MLSYILTPLCICVCVCGGGGGSRLETGSYKYSSWLTKLLSETPTLLLFIVTVS
jgi:hypothetical protein